MHISFVSRVRLGFALMVTMISLQSLSVAYASVAHFVRQLLMPAHTMLHPQIPSLLDACLTTCLINFFWQCEGSFAGVQRKVPIPD